MFKKDKEREKAAKMIRDEAKKMSTLFLRLSHATNPKVSILLVEHTIHVTAFRHDSLLMMFSSTSLPVHSSSGAISRVAEL